MKIDLPVSLSILRSLKDSLSLPFNSHDLIASSLLKLLYISL